ncbi:uncharacterized protein EI90DRAFT_3284783 [Cantharellus anzutake]|uniref:uncharacterized protein n=1 Tax=Cantharellus anzutake TaxID=1750568 RepID=UPI0019048987|nr:uncharacterized protein EI90DRAFT_3284783 [Cantharellus anzutake]KAF8342623.1 hypothetical protein EI90DRAFT_3284783 [Cantharellus anzutake]
MTFVVDVLVLGSEAFTTILDVPSSSTPEEEELHDDDDPMPNFQPDPDPDPILPTYPFPTPTSLQSILESPNIVKGFFDVRNDSMLYTTFTTFHVQRFGYSNIGNRDEEREEKIRDGGLEKEALNGWLAVKEVGKKYFKASEGKSGGGGGAEERENRGETSRKRIEEGDGGTEKKVVVMTGTERPGTLEQPTIRRRRRRRRRRKMMLPTYKWGAPRVFYQRRDPST